MTTCSNCYNGCAEKVADKCVMYTGADNPLLGISTGDTLLFVEQQISAFLATVSNGTGVIPTIDDAITICDLITQYIPVVNPITVNNWIEVLIKSICTLQAQVTVINGDLIAAEADIATIEASYTVNCLSDVISSSGTHAVLQATITRLCELVATLAENYSANGTELNTQISAYLSANPPTSTKMKYRMVPYTAIEYYGSLTGKFDASGVGLTGTDWENIYLCNGQNGTPDKRGRVAVGITTVPGGEDFDAAVDPAISPNPTYTLAAKSGANSITLTSAQMPVHTHSNTPSTSTHTHDILGITGGDNNDNSNIVRFAGGDKIQGETAFYFTNTSACQSASVTPSISISDAGSGDAHMNIQPVIACYYIIYLP